MRFALIFATLGIAAASDVSAAPNLVTNGGFESSTYSTNTQFGGGFGGQGVTGWTGAGGNQLQFYFIGGTQATITAANQFGDPLGYFRPNFNTLSPNGGNFVALDGDSDYRGYISQTLTGLTAGKKYDVKFSWAASQFRNRTGPTTEQLTVGFGSALQSTPVIAVPSEGFKGWFNEKLTFTAGSATQMLSFLSIGTPNGLPPIALLDGVSVAAVPEPAMWALMVAGFGLVGVATRRRNRTIAA